MVLPVATESRPVGAEGAIQRTKDADLYSVRIDAHQALALRQRIRLHGSSEG